MTLFESNGLFSSFASSSSMFVSNGLLGPSKSGAPHEISSGRHTSTYVSARNFDGMPIPVMRKKKTHQTHLSRAPRNLEGLLEVPTHRMLEKLSLGTDVSGPSVIDRNTSVQGEATRTSMWVDQYKPKCFTDLLGDERVHRETMAWLKEWDQCVFGRRKRRPMKEAATDAPFYQDEHGRPKEKAGGSLILLLSGPPGLGKTTLAHILGKQAGYGVTEINASDARTGSIVDDKIRPVLESGTAMGTNKPVLMVIDEIDGATGDNASGFVNKLIQLTFDKPRAKKGRGDKNKPDTRPLLRPIICICNDLYAPSLARLRPIARIIRFRKPQSILLANRLRDICQTEELRADARALTKLVTVSQGDMRACINTLQFIKSRTHLVTEQEVSRCTVGMKETEGSVQSAWHDLFTPLTAKTRKLVSGASALDSDQYVARLSRVVDNAGADKVMTACFEHYTTLRKCRSEWTSLLTAHEWFEWYDLLTMRMRSEQEYALLGYQPYAIVPFHSLFAALGNPKYERANTDWEQFTRARLNDDIRTTVCNGLMNGSRDANAASYLHLMGGSKAALEFLPLINRIISPPLKPLNSQIVRTQERILLKRLVEIMAAMDIRYVQEKNEEGQLVYRLDPAIDVFVTYDGKRAADMNISRFAVRQMVAEELDAEFERRKHDATPTGKPGQLDFGSARKPLSTTASGPGQAKDPATSAQSKPVAGIGEKRPLDFFGRPVVPKQLKDKGAGVGGRKPSSSIGAAPPLPPGYKIKYKFNEGNSSAVRKPVKISSML